MRSQSTTLDTESRVYVYMTNLSLAQRLRDELEEAIIQGAMPPGTHLDEAQLAARFGVSRTPIREALTQLAGAGLLERRPRRGVIVATIPFDRLLEMFEVMAELEGLAARLAARRHKPSDAARINECHENCRAALERGDRDDYYYENERFHQAIQESSYSGFLIEQCKALSRRLRPYRRLQLDTSNRISGSFHEHEAIVGALMSRDPERAYSEMRGHVLIQGERFGDLLAALKRQATLTDEIVN